MLALTSILVIIAAALLAPNRPGPSSPPAVPAGAPNFLDTSAKLAGDTLGQKTYGQPGAAPHAEINALGEDALEEAEPEPAVQPIVRETELQEAEAEGGRPEVLAAD